MKTSVDIPDDLLEEAQRRAGAKTKREAILTALEAYNQRGRMADLTRHLGTCADLMRPEELERLRGEEG